MALDLLIRNALVVRENGVARLDVGVAAGKIVALAEEISEHAAEEINAAGLHVLPGLIDSHVHFNDPGRAEWEGVTTGSSALAAGGGTCFFDMPLNSSPPTLDGKSFDLKRATCEANSLTDFALWGGLVPENVDRLEELAERGVVGFKAFMSNSGIHDFHHCDDWSLFRGMQIAARLGLPVALHAEDDAITAALAADAARAKKNTIADYLASRPVIAELEAITRALLFAEETGCKLHVVHVSTARGVQLIRRAVAARYCHATCETCPHYLMLCAEDMQRIGAYAKCAPPLRPSEQRDALLAAVKNSQVDTIGSDHSPAPAAMKTSSNFFEIWGGITGVQTTLRSLLTLNLPEPLIANLTAGNVARRFALPHKGAIAVDNDADFVLVDPTPTTALQTEELMDRHRLSPYVGMAMRGRIHRTILRGRTIFADGKIVAVSAGQFVRPTLLS